MTKLFSTGTACDDALRHHYLRIDGKRLHCVSVGSGEPVLLIPGWPQTWYAWRHILHALAEAGFQAIAVDPPGIGESDRPEHGYDTGSAAAVLHQSMQMLGHDRYQVVGHDIGMWIAYALASDQPQAVQRLAVTEAVIPGLAPEPGIFAEPADNVFLWHFMFNQVADLPEALVTGRERAYLEFIFDRWAYRRDAVASETYISVYSRPGAMRAGFAWYRAIPETIRQNQQRAQRRLSMPVLAIGGEHATGDAPIRTLYPLADDLRGSVVPGCGHFIMEEAPQAFLAQLLPFLLGDFHAA